MPAPQRFITAYHNYLPTAQDARTKNEPERQRSALLLGFIQNAFEVETQDFRLEQAILIGNVQRKGYMDALFGDLIFEFKRQLTADARNQLLDYLRSQTDGREHIGILTDGLMFEVHILEKNELRQIDSFDLETADAESAFTRLDKYLFSQENVAPTSDDVVQRFGSSSPTFNKAFQSLGELFSKVKDQPALSVWRDQWGKLLSKVYGSDVADDDLYLRHTYLCQFAKLLAYAALRRIPPDDTTVRSIINGEAFYSEGVNNIGEHDFFAWILLPEIEAQTIRLFRRLAEGLVVYDLARIDQDLLKQLYQNLVDPATRHNLGEFYTPDWLAELTLEDINYHHPQSLLDPACGSGSFLFTALRRLAEAELTGWSLVSFAVDNVMGMDVHPLAITIARINYLLALSEHLKATRPARRSGLIAIPIYMADALAAPELESKYKETLVVPVDEKRNENFFIPVSAAQSPEALTEVIGQMDEFAQLAKDPLKTETYKRAFEKLVQERFTQESSGLVSDMTLPYWVRNLTLLTNLIRENRNSIWAYILKNQSRPLILSERKFDVIVGNPPWLSYRFIKSKTYQKEVKALYQYYELIESNDTKLFTQMDLSTLFFVHARRRYLKSGGTLAFVMPRSVITGAKQHRPFQAQGMTRVLDLLAVQPLFNVPSCVIILASDSPSLYTAEGATVKIKREERALKKLVAPPEISSNDEHKNHPVCVS
ncbi:MAG: N-6 DNA methylase, partial [Anaerolineaceae bacterium]|nr:N-6 DNA methylase [Anaerolineaceae bacterium]